MKKKPLKIISVILAAVMLLSAGAAGISAFAAQEQPALVKNVTRLAEPPEGYTAITTAAQLNAVRNNLSGKYILMNDIDLAAFGNWSPIGTAQAPFTGIFNGNGYAVKNMSIIISSENVYAGLFGYSKASVTINVAVKNVQIISNAQQFHFVGAIVGLALNSFIANCSCSGTVSAQGGTLCAAGGIVGSYSCNGSLSNCSNYANVEYKVSDKSGADIIIGGVVGSADSSVDNCLNMGNISIKKSSEVTSDDGFAKIGGLAGETYKGVINCYNIGTVEADFTSTLYAGGLVGIAFSIESSYTAGCVTAISAKPNESFYGALCGYAAYQYYTDSDEKEEIPYVHNSYYRSNVKNAIGKDGVKITGQVKSLTDSEMRNKASFFGFDFKNIWTISDNSYPTINTSVNEIKTKIMVCKSQKSVISRNVEILCWESTNNSVAVVEDEVVKGVLKGEAELTVITSDGQFATIEVTVQSFWQWLIIIFFFGFAWY